MITYDHPSRTVIMDLVNLEHCGFDVKEFHDELFLSGTTDEKAQWPNLLIVKFATGAVITINKEQELLDKQEKA